MKQLPNIPKPPFDIPQAVLAKARNIRLAAFDVDGIMTDGGLYYSEDGEALKRFNVLDGQGLKLLQRCGIEVAIISAKKSAPLLRRIQDLNIQHSYVGSGDKMADFTELRNALGVSTEQCCFAGDDLVDIEVMQVCGLAFSTPNAHYSAQQSADWISPISGGQGAVRAICDVLLYAQNPQNYSA